MQADVIEGLRQQHKKDLAKVVDIVLSHQVRQSQELKIDDDHKNFHNVKSNRMNCIPDHRGHGFVNLLCLQGVKRKNQLILRLMGALVYPNPAAYREQLIRFAELNHSNYAEVFVVPFRRFYLKALEPQLNYFSLRWPKMTISY